jgi:hypothetical protein
LARVGSKQIEMNSMANNKKSKATGASLAERTAMFGAVYAPLMGRPISDEGRAVVVRLCEAITAHERTAGLRKYERGRPVLSS